ncbi:MAG: carboxypeptidase regulatory-like domain-containing protein, partial [Calditrichaeota bacterium]
MKFSFKNKRPILTVIILSMGILFLGFCILTNSQGYHRHYLDSDLPFNYTLNNSTPSNWVPIIDAGAETWDNVPSCYFEFQNGGFTLIGSLGFDGVNLVFFDINGDNFPPGTNTIAFSSTWTTGGGASYHAVESDLIWNARDFPPGTNGEPGMIDLQGTISHEFGHHLGMGHTGPVGGPPGCGELITEATMYGTVAFGDTTQRSLHIDDKAGCSMIYPVWKLEGSITDASTGQPIPDAEVRANQVFAGINTGPVESPQTGVYEVPGAAVSAIPTDNNGDFSAVILYQTVTVEVQYFAYQTQTFTAAYNPPGGIGQTQVITQNFALQPSPMVTISGMVKDSVSGAPIAANLEIYTTSNKPGAPDTSMGSVVSSDGNYTFTVPAFEDYEIIVTPETPYPQTTVTVTNLPGSGLQLDIPLNVARILVVNDDVDNSGEVYFQEALDNIGQSYHVWRTSEKGVPQLADYLLFPSPRMVIWFTGNASNAVLSDAEQQSLAEFLDNGGRLLLTGKDIAETSSSGTLLTNYLEVSHAGNYVPPAVRGVPGDPIGEGLLVLTTGGPGNQNSKDIFTVGSTPIVSFNYGSGGNMGVAGVRVENSQNNWKAVFLGFGFETINNDNGFRDQILSNILTYFGVITGIDEPVEQVSDV